MNRMCFSTNRKSLEFISLVFAWFDWSSIGARSVESVFQFIETNFWQIVIFKENFLFGLIGTRPIKIQKKRKTKDFSRHMFFTFSNTFLLFTSFSFSTDQIQTFFVVFLLKSLKVFVLKYRSDLNTLPFSSYLHCSCIFFMIFELKKFGVFDFWLIFVHI